MVSTHLQMWMVELGPFSGLLLMVGILTSHHQTHSEQNKGVVGEMVNRISPASPQVACFFRVDRGVNILDSEEVVDLRPGSRAPILYMIYVSILIASHSLDLREFIDP